MQTACSGYSLVTSPSRSRLAATRRPTEVYVAQPKTEADARRFATLTRLRTYIDAVYWGWWIVGVAFVSQLVTVSANSYATGAFVKPMTTELEWTRSEFAIARTVGQFVVAGAGLFIGTHVDRHGGRRLMIIGSISMSAALFLTAYVTHLWQWLLLNGIIISAGSAMCGSLVVYVTLSKWFVEQRGRAVSIAAMGVSFAGVVITPASAWLVGTFGWRAAWQILGVWALVLMAPIPLMMRRTPEEYGLYPDGKTAAEVAAGGGRAAADDFARSLNRAQAVRTPAFYLLVFGFGLGSMNIGVMLLQMIPFLTDAGYSAQVAANMMALTSAPSMLSKPIWGWLADRVDAKSAIVGFLTNTVALVLIVFAVRAHSNVAVYAGFILLGFGWGGNQPMQEAVWASFFGRRYIGAVRSAALPVTLFIGAGAPLLTSYYYDVAGNYDGAFLAIAALAVVGSVLILFARKPGSLVGVATTA